MLRIAVADVDRTVVVRDDLLTVLYRPALLRRQEGVLHALKLLTPEECGIVRAHVGVRAGEDCAKWHGIAPDIVCPCYIPLALRSPIDVAPCPLHDDVKASLRAVADGTAV